MTNERWTNIIIILLVMIMLPLGAIGTLYLKAKHDLKTLLNTKTSGKYEIELRSFSLVGVSKNRIGIFVFEFGILSANLPPVFEWGITSEGITTNHYWGYYNY